MNSLADRGITDCRSVGPWVGSGTIKLLLSLPPKEADKLCWAVHSGALDDLGVTDFDYGRPNHSEEEREKNRSEEEREKDDAALVRQVLAGHTNAYSQLVQRWAGRILAVCHARLNRPDVAEELAQETLVRGFEQLPSLSEPARFGPWLAGIAIKTCLDWHWTKNDWRYSEVPFSALQDNGHQLVAPVVDELEWRDEVEALPEEYRTVVMLFYYQQASYRDIAHLLDVSPATVNARLTRARLLLRGRLAPPVPPETRSAS
jgi:RNA polymerase sigma-70 factor (ECF subfamily)